MLFRAKAHTFGEPMRPDMLRVEREIASGLSDARMNMVFCRMTCETGDSLDRVLFRVLFDGDSRVSIAHPAVRPSPNFAEESHFHH